MCISHQNPKQVFNVVIHIKTIHVIFCLKYMLFMWHDIIFICPKQIIVNSTRLSVLWITALIFNFFKKCPHHDNNDECMLLADMQHSHPHITLYPEVIILSWGGRIFHNVESLIIILLSWSLASFSPPFSGGIPVLLWSSCTETCKNNFGADFFVFYINKDIKTIISNCRYQKLGLM